MGKEPRPRTQWRAIGQSVRGAAHLRTGLPNQDAIRWLPASGIGPPLILAISDGHGSAKYFRSHVGSEQAVETVAWVIQDLLDGQPDPTNLSAIKRTAEDRLPREVVRRWKESVAEHLKQSPLTPDELGALEQRDGAAARQAILDNPTLAYGATVLAVLVAETFILYLQLGDGDILIIAEDGGVTRPLKRDMRLFANQTTSLCSTDAWRDVQVRFQALVDPPPAVILLATDGYANSFVNEAAFLQVGTDIWDLIRTEGLAAVQGDLATWLNEASQAGSGDDITLGILCRSDIEPQSEPEELTEPVLVVSGPQTGEIDSSAEVDELTWTLTLKRVPRSKKK
jgi:serine/threonine protein phosphatase PrpC